MSKADDLFNEAAGEPGHAGHEPQGAYAPPPEKITDTPLGELPDVAKNFANTMTFGAAPVLEGAMGAVAKQAVEPFASPQALLDAYRSVRDEGAKEHAASAKTGLGKLGGAVAYVAPHPLLPGAGELGPQALPSVVRKGLQSAAVGGGVGAISGAANSPADLMSDQPGQAKRMLLDAAGSAIPGALTSIGVRGVLGVGNKVIGNPVRQLAEEQALRAAGLRGGIKNSLQKDLGIENMGEARQLGRQFLDEGLIPRVGSSEAVAKRAEALQGQASNAVGSTLNQFEVGGGKFDYPEAAEAMRRPILDPSQTTAVARKQAGKALDLANTIENEQSIDTPGSIIGANRAKSDAWKAANFSNDPDLAAATYRKAVSGLRGNIEDQVAREMGPEASAHLANANERYGVAADALKLAANASTRDAAKKGITMGDLLALTTGTAAGGASGHPIAGPVGGLGGVLALKAFDKYGHSTAARGADALANRFSESTGGHLGGMMGEEENKLAPWEQFLHKDEDSK